MDFEAFYGVARLGRQEHLDAIKTDNRIVLAVKPELLMAAGF